MLWEALHIAALDSVVAEKGGLGFRLGESGRGLSGGEKRRLALARMVLRKPRILLLDEPTEGLADETAETVLARLRVGLPRCGDPDRRTQAGRARMGRTRYVTRVEMENIQRSCAVLT